MDRTPVIHHHHHHAAAFSLSLCLQTPTQALSKVPANRLTLLHELLAVAGGLGESALTELGSLRRQLSVLLPPTSTAEGGGGGKAGGAVVGKPSAIPASVVTLSAKSSEVGW